MKLMSSPSDQTRIADLFPSQHLWLVPSGEGYDRLAALIRDLGNTYDAPVFEPHITLLGFLPGTDEDIMSTCCLLSENFPPFRVSLGAVGHQDSYFRCLYLYVEPTLEVMNIHAQASAKFHRRDDRLFEPHVSLLYGTYSRDLKKHVISALPSKLPRSVQVDAMHWIRAKSENPKDWECREVFRLKGYEAKGIPG